MIEPLHERAVVDRFEGPYAVLLIGAARRPMDVLRQQLPPRIREGTWVQVQLVDDQIVAAEIDDAATEDARLRIQEKLARLRQGDHLKGDD